MGFNVFPNSTRDIVPPANLAHRPISAHRVLSVTQGINVATTNLVLKIKCVIKLKFQCLCLVIFPQVLHIPVAGVRLLPGAETRGADLASAIAVRRARLCLKRPIRTESIAWFAGVSMLKMFVRARFYARFPIR
jgi:hypothetical protein